MERLEPAEPWSCCCWESPAHSMSTGQGFLLLEVSVLIKHVGKRRGAAPRRPEKGAWLASPLADSSAGGA